MELDFIRIKKHDLEKALSCLETSLNIIENKDPIIQNYYEQMRNSAIKCFEFSIDTFWKFLKEYLIKVYQVQITVHSPKSIFQEAFKVNLINQKMLEICIGMFDDRNLTSHTYKEDLAEEILNRLPEYYKCMKEILNQINI